MDYAIRRNREELNIEVDATGYVEIGPGVYGGEEWHEGSLIIWADAFSIVEGIIMKHFPDYEDSGLNDLSADVGKALINEFKEVATKLKSCSTDQYDLLLNTNAVFSESMADEISENVDSIIVLLEELAKSFGQFYEKEQWVWILCLT